MDNVLSSFQIHHEDPPSQYRCRRNDRGHDQEVYTGLPVEVTCKKSWKLHFLAMYAYDSIVAHAQ